MPNPEYIDFVIESAFSKGVLEALPEDQQKKLSGLITYILSKEAVINLESIIENFQIGSKIVAQIGQEGYRLGNLLCAGGGVMIGGSSAINYSTTTNGLAKTCYVISGLCGGSATIFGVYSTATSYCGLSMLAAGGDILGGSFLWVGNKVQKMGQCVEGKRPWNLRPKNFVRRPISEAKRGLGYKGMGFVTAAPFDVPFETILIIGGTVFTVYGYGKIMIAIYRYINKKLSPKIDISNSARLLIDSFN